MKHLILGTAGHIDHGKTSLVKALTGIDTDRLKEEKARGITIELGFAHLDLPGGVEGQRLAYPCLPGWRCQQMATARLPRPDSDRPKIWPWATIRRPLGSFSVRRRSME